MEARGIIHFIGATQATGKDPAKPFLKRELVLTYGDNPQYPQLVPFIFSQDRVGLLDAFAIGQEAQVDFDLAGRAWTNDKNETKYFGENRAFNVRAVNVGQPQHVSKALSAAAANVATAHAKPGPAPANVEAGENDDLPF